MSLIDLASLVLAPTATKEGKVYSAIPDTGEGDMTFTRGSAATRVNSAGLIEKERGNLLLQSNTFDTTWLKTDLTATSGATDPNGGSTAWTIENTAANGNIQQAVSFTGLRNVSLYAKQGTHRYLRMGVYGGTSSYANFDLQDGVVSSGTKATIEAIGGGWYRCTAWGADGTTGGVQIFPSNNSTSAPTTNGNILIWRAQYEQGLVATDYIETTTTAIYEGITDDVPRVDYSGGGCPSLLLEPQRTNKLPQSEYFEDSNFTIGNITFEGGYLAPDGTNSAYKITATSKSTAFLAYATIFDANDARSIYAKTVSGTGTTQLLSHHDNTNNTFTLTEEWQRFELTSTPSVSQNFYPVDFRGSTTLTEVIIWGGQAEAGSYSTSYIPTYGVSSTRVADSCSKTGISSLLNLSEGAVFLEINTFDNETASKVFTIGDGSTNTIQVFYYEDSIRLNFKSGGLSYAYFNHALTDVNDTIKVAISYATNDIRMYVNGVLTNSDTSATMPSALSYVRFDNGSGGALFYGNAKQIVYFPTALTNTQLEELTK